MGTADQVQSLAGGRRLGAAADGPNGVRARPRLTYDALTGGGVVVILTLAAIFLFLLDLAQRAAFSNILGPIVDLLAVASLVVAAWRARARSRRFALAWTLIAAAVLLYALGDITWTILELYLHDAPFPSQADAFYLAYFPCFLVGVSLIPRPSPTRASQINRGLDIATILAVAALAFWNFLLGPILETSRAAPALEQVILLSYPVGDLALLGALLFLIYGDTDERDLRWVHVLGVGIILMIAADTVYSYRSLQGTYVSGDVLDLGWIFGILIFGLAGASQWTRPEYPEINAAPRRLSAVQRWMQAGNPYVPYVWLLGAFVLLILRALMPLPMSFLTMALGVGVIMVLVLARQFITLLDNNRLTGELKQQADDLERSNRYLNDEIAERRRIQEKLSYDTLHDGLTGLANRALFLVRLGQAMKRSQRHRNRSLAVLFLDIDHFKIVNDSLGHIQGDRLLVLIGQRLKQTVRSVDTVARFGGDEFTILLEELNEKISASVLTDRIQAAVAKPFVVNERTVHISVSIGIATNALQYERPEDMVRDADLALYRAKSLGKARSEVFHLKMRDQAFWRLEMEEDLRRALEEHEFELYYQPIRSLKTGKIVSLEALVRWMHPERGLIMPAEFLSVAEESGLIVPLGAWVLKQACRQLKLWQVKYPHLKDVTVSVNISNREFAGPDLADKVAAALRVSKLKGSSLRLEITEQVMLGNQATASRIIAALRDLGVQLQVDDFGVGYSALAYLQQFPIQAIKIDRSFVHGIRRDRRGRGLMRAMVAMARELGVESIAEGIETREELRELKELACGFGQGFFLCEPLDAASMEYLWMGPKRKREKV